MSYVNGYPRRPHYSNVGYGNNRPGYDTNYGADYRPGYDARGYQSYQQPVTYGSRRHNSYNHHPGSQVAYTSGVPQHVTRGGEYYPYHHGSSRHAPNVIMASGSSIRRQATPYVSSSTSARYRAEGHRGEPIPVVAGAPYHEEYIPLTTRIRRLFGIGPRRSSTHIGRTVHVKRWGFGRHGFHTTRQYSTWNLGHRSRDTVYTL